jgi:hypothetical protein
VPFRRGENHAVRRMRQWQMMVAARTSAATTCASNSGERDIPNKPAPYLDGYWQREPRVINTASASHRGATLDLDSLQSAKSFGPIRAYGRSEICNILFTRELARPAARHRRDGELPTSWFRRHALWRPKRRLDFSPLLVRQVFRNITCKRRGNHHLSCVCAGSG